jgi:hypothetical protein
MGDIAADWTCTGLHRCRVFATICCIFVKLGPDVPSVAVTRFLGLFTGYAERGKVCTANEIGLASTNAGRVFNTPLLVALSWVSSHEHLGLGYCFCLAAPVLWTTAPAPAPERTRCLEGVV